MNLSILTFIIGIKAMYLELRDRKRNCTIVNTMVVAVNAVYYEEDLAKKLFFLWVYVLKLFFELGFLLLYEIF